MIREFATAVGDAARKQGLNFIFAHAAAANVEADAAVGATCELRVISGGMLDANGSIFSEKIEALMMCYKPMPFDFTGFEAAAVVDEMKETAIGIISEISMGWDFEREIKFTTLYDTYDVNVGGVAVEFTINGRPQCLG